MENIRVAIFEDNKHLRESLYYLINGTPGFSCTGAYPDCNDAVFQITKDTPDVILMDIEMPGLNGIQGVKLIKSKFPQVHVLMQTIFHDENNIFDAICAGASGYILKSTTPAEYITAIKDVYNGGSPMTGSIARRYWNYFKKIFRLKQKKIISLLLKKKKCYNLWYREKVLK